MNSVFKKGISVITSLFSDSELSSASVKVKLFAKNFSMNSTLDDFGISFPVFPSRTNLKLYNTYVTPRFIPKFKSVGERCAAKNYLPVSLLSS